MTKTQPKPVKPEKKKRERCVYPTDQIPHLWAHQTQSEARSAGGARLFFDGDTIYSYGIHFPIARIVVVKSRGQPDRRCVFFTSRSYSVTTAHHIRMVKRALHSRLGPVFYGSDPRRTPSQEVAALGTAIASCARDLKGMRGYARRGNAYRALLLDLENLTRLADLFRLQKEVPRLDRCLTASEIESLEADLKRLDAAEVNRQHTRARIMALREIEYQEQLAGRKSEWAAAERQLREQEASEQRERIERREEYLTTWRAGGSVPHHFLDSGSVPTMLRIVGNQVQSSLGAEFPLDHGMRVMRLIRRIIERRQTWHSNGRQIRLGRFQLDSINADGTVHAGCHTVQGAEVLRVIAEAEARPEAVNYPEDTCESESSAVGVGVEDSSDGDTSSG